MGTSSSVPNKQSRKDGNTNTTPSTNSHNNESLGSDSDNRLLTGQDSSLDGTPRTERKIFTTLAKRKSGSIRKGSVRTSHMITDLEAEVEKLKKEFDVFRLQKETEIEQLNAAKEKSNNEIKRLKGEVKVTRDACSKLVTERDNAVTSEKQAIARAATFQQERDKIQRQFKLYRETKESELHELLKTKRELEGKLFRQNTVDSTSGSAIVRENSAKAEVRTLGGVSNVSNPPLVSDWSTSLESSWSINWAAVCNDKGPEASQLGDIDGPYLNINKDDWKAASMALSKSLPLFMQIAPINSLKVYVSAPKGLEKEVEILNQVYVGKLQDMCQRHGFSQMEFDHGHLRCAGSRPAIFCFRNIAWDQQFPVKADTFRGYSAKQLKVMIRNSKNAKAIDNYSSPDEGAELAFKELRKLVKLILGIEDNEVFLSSNGDSDSAIIENSDDAVVDDEDILDKTNEWDILGEAEQLESLRIAADASDIFGLDEHIAMVSKEINAEGPSPPLLIIGDQGSGKSLLSAKWIEEYQKLHPDCIILYHFVGLPNSISADSLLMLKRLTMQLMRHTRQRNKPTNDPFKLQEDFLTNLEKVATERNSRVILLLDSADRFRSCETELKWLLDPFPSEVKVILTCKEGTIPEAWRPWPSVYIRRMTEEHCKLLLKSLTDNIISFADDQEDAIVTKAAKLSSSAIFITLVSKELTKKYESSNLDDDIDACLSCEGTTDLYCHILSQIEKECEPQEEKGVVRKVLSSIYASRNGLTEAEILKLAAIDWKTWGPIVTTFKDNKILIEKCGVLTFPFQLVRNAIKSKYMSDKMHGVIDVAATIRHHLIYFHSSTLLTE
ncbi:uncharacterized protein TRIADDRAFT_54460 [Trichoplax adhaerens]|uniref:Uncharacterized protein n=1 Tax=Trichoplax adhaerens TaxID=10228 RepID=B3RS36_TRIAD|nr:hypothetical protein TRIADDRAFT_54460 [Trichoplax adhaerens]EDV26449.1 hypothetical protein TRIADDRAFT_54460 [Trichoplax adhaerens]|eukprot:XP_002110445.1 hypothetical protein TRIADDRAFT_54460 [Trichoplax adhaerens]